MENTNLDEYKTSDTALAAYLKMSMVRIKDMEVSGTRVSFVFEDVPRELIRNFNAGLTSVEPMEFTSRLKQLTQIAKRLVKEEQTNK